MYKSLRAVSTRISFKKRKSFRLLLKEMQRELLRLRWERKAHLPVRAISSGCVKTLEDILQPNNGLGSRQELVQACGLLASQTKWCNASFFLKSATCPPKTFKDKMCCYNRCWFWGTWCSWRTVTGTCLNLHVAARSFREQEGHCCKVKPALLPESTSVSYFSDNSLIYFSDYQYWCWV